jgi:hypothetical protein
VYIEILADFRHIRSTPYQAQPRDHVPLANKAVVVTIC